MNSKDNTTVKQNNPTIKQLAQLRKSLAEIEELRYKSIKNSHNAKKSNLAEQQSTLQLEQASVELRRAERVLITKLSTDIASKIKADGESLEALASKIRKRVEKMGRLPKRLDVISKAILNIITLI